MNTKTYHHVQYAPFWLLFLLISIIQFMSAVLFDIPDIARITLALSGVALAGLALSFQYLSVKDADDRLIISFGPLPLFKTSIEYADMLDVEAARTRLIDGLGVHYSLGRGWLWNIWGRQCVSIHHKRGTTLVGTDDPEGLVEFLRTRIV